MAAALAWCAVMWAADSRRGGEEATPATGFVGGRYARLPLVPLQEEPPARALLVARARVSKSPFMRNSTHRGTTKNGKKRHFTLLDRYIRRIDALLPEEMEDLVRPLGYSPDPEYSSKTIRIAFPELTNWPNVTEGDVRAFTAPLEPAAVALGWFSWAGYPEVYVHFETNEDCRAARQLDGQDLNGLRASVTYSVDRKWKRVVENLRLVDVPEEKEMEAFEQRFKPPRRLAEPDGRGRKGRRGQDPGKPANDDAWLASGGRSSGGPGGGIPSGQPAKRKQPRWRREREARIAKRISF